MVVIFLILCAFVIFVGGMLFWFTFDSITKGEDFY